MKPLPDLKPYYPQLISIFREIDETENLDWPKFRKILNRHPRDEKYVFSKEILVAGYRELVLQNNSEIPQNKEFLAKIQMKPMRTQSGVTPVTVLTKPFPCPGQCIFCPSDIRMPKSYLSDEPGAQRAEKNNFDPYLQTYRRIKALHLIGHNVEKIEIIILGGTWSFYPERYQIWFIKRIFEALNDFGEDIDQTIEVEKQTIKPIIPKEFGKEFLSREKGVDSPLIMEGQTINSELSSLNSIHPQNTFLENAEAVTKLSKSTYNVAVTKIIKATHEGRMIEENEQATWEELELQQKRNETAKCRSVGLVIETRPDYISPEEVVRIRRLGCTKTQIGFQSLNDEVLEKNHRGHKVGATRKAIKLLRLAGFKIHGHWMANLYGSDPEKDILDFKKMFEDKDFRPDELKVYPCSLLDTAELLDYYEKGLWKPYSHQELLDVVSGVIAATPEYCRLTRVIRDIPSTDIVVGNKFTNFREMAEKELDRRGIQKLDIRSREIKNTLVTKEELELKITKYESSIGWEYFLQFVTKENQIAGFLRLCLPDEQTHPFLPELTGAAIIREVHVYGKAVAIGDNDEGKAQHLGLGTSLLEKAKEMAKIENYPKIAVISAIGTKEYYRKKGFSDDGLYQSIVF